MSDRSYRGRARRHDPTPPPPPEEVEEGEESPESPGRSPPAVPASPATARSRGRARARARSASREEREAIGAVEVEAAEGREEVTSPSLVMRGLRLEGEGDSPTSVELVEQYLQQQEGENGSGNGNGNGNGNGDGNGNGSGSGGEDNGRGRPGEGVRASRFGFRRVDPRTAFDVVPSLPPNTAKTGAAGTPVKLFANFFKVDKKPEWALYHYNVKYNPDIDSIGLRKGLLREHAANLPPFIFDGASLHTANIIPENMLELVSIRRNDQSPVQIKFELVSQLAPEDGMYLHFYNLMGRKCLQLVGFALMGRNYFDYASAANLAQYRLQIWPGFATTMRVHDGGLLYCVASISKVIRKQTILDLMTEIRRSTQGQGQEAMRNAIRSEVVGSIVMTHYNRKTYRVDDIAWNERVTDSFPTRNGSMTFIDYYRSKYQIEPAPNQPLLISNPTKRDQHRGQNEPIKLLPEFCYITGLSESMRQNFQLMRSLGEYLFQTPNVRMEKLTQFMHRVLSNPDARSELEKWGFRMNRNLVELTGRQLPPENVRFREERGPDNKLKDVLVNEKGDFTIAFRGSRLGTAPPLHKWVIIVPRRDMGHLDNLLQMMERVSRPLGFHISPPERLEAESRNVVTYVKLIEDSIKKYGGELQMIFTVLPDSKLDLYAAIKKRCYVDYGMPSQCFLSKTMGNKGLMSICTKLAVQMCCKLGGEGWYGNIPMKNTMIVGFDVHHGGAGSSGGSIGAMVCTISDTYGKYFSTIIEAGQRQEITGAIHGELAKCLKAYQKSNNNQLPERIFFYRDGVGEGQLQSVFNTELENVKEMIRKVYANSKKPGFTYIVVTKRINPRFFTFQKQNPGPGTIVDTVVTFPERYDFYLIAQSVRQGTVSPTSYHVLCNFKPQEVQQPLDADKIQRLTYKLCHLYYNFSGTVAVPMVCQYAHKLAFLTGTATRAAAHESLSRQLYFL